MKNKNFIESIYLKKEQKIIISKYGIFLIKHKEIFQLT